MTKNKTIIVKDQPVTIIEVNKQDYISLTDIIKRKAGLNNFKISVKEWAERTRLSVVFY